MNTGKKVQPLPEAELEKTVGGYTLITLLPPDPPTTWIKGGGDINGDGAPDIVAATRGGTAQVK